MSGDGVLVVDLTREKTTQKGNQKKMSKRQIIRVNDLVVLNDPRPIERIGYDMSVETMIPQVENDPDVIAFIKSQKLIDSSAQRVIMTVAVSRVRSEMKYARDAKRKIFYREIQEDYRGFTARVIDKRIHQIGIYYPFSSRYSSYDGDYDHDPAGLDDRQTVVCLQLNLGTYLIDNSYSQVDWSGFWVTSDQTAKVYNAS